MSDEAEAIKADIEQARAELAGTADALAAKLDVKAQASRKVHDAGERVTGAYENAKHAAPEPVQKAWMKAEVVAQPVVATAAADKKRTVLVLAGVVAAVLVIRRLTR